MAISMPQINFKPTDCWYDFASLEDAVISPDGLSIGFRDKGHPDDDKRICWTRSGDVILVDELVAYKPALSATDIVAVRDYLSAKHAVE